MERMENFKDKVDRLVGEYIEELEEENKNLKLIQKTNEKQIQNDIKERDELREENKKLKEERDLYKARNEELNEDCFGLANENKKLRDDVEYFRQIYLDLKKMCEDDGYLLTDEEVTKLFNLDEIRHKK